MQTQPTRDSSSRFSSSAPIRSFRHKAVVALMALALLTPAALVWAHPGGGGGGGGGGGSGGHASAGGGSPGGGAHFGGGGGASFGGGAHFGGGGGANFGGGAHFSATPHFSGGPRFTAPASAPHFSAPAPHFSSPAPHYNAAAPNWNGNRGYPNHGPSYHAGTQGNVTARVGIAPRAPIDSGRFADGHSGGQYGHGNGYGHGDGYGRGNGYGHGGYDHGGYDHHWNGGYWHGHYWPPVYYRPGFVWFLPVLPAYCVTYWWGGIPYYYYDEAYYTWNPNDGGYEATEPPPVGDAPVADDGAAPAYSDAAPANQSDYGVTYGSPDPNAQNGDATDPNADGYNGSPAYNGASGSAGDNLYAYPKNGQSPEQQGQDRRECAEWASAQSPDAANSSSMDYKRALTACLSGRGYSVD